MNLKLYHTLKQLLPAITCLGLTHVASAQLLQVTGGNTAPFTPQNLISNIFLGEGVEVTNITYGGVSSAVGYFTGGTQSIGIERGIVMTTGVAKSTQAAATFGADGEGVDFATVDNSSNATDANLAALTTAGLNDVAVYTITFIPTADTLRFRYCFGSEEYPEYACSQFNDVFGFFISGPNPAGGNYNNVNIAKVPGTNLPVTINNIHPANPIYNCGPFNAQYYNNNNGTGLQPVYDGFTDVFVAEAVVTPCQQYTIKLAIADVTDGIYDSGVFLEAKSFGTGSLQVEVATVSADGSLTEGCAQGSLVFRLPTPAQEVFNIDYNIWGTATNGTDYQAIPMNLSIGVGQTEVSVPIIALEDNLSETGEFIAIDVQRDPCNRDTIFIGIRDNGLVAPSLRPDTAICINSTVLNLDGTLPITLPPPPSFTNSNDFSINPPNAPIISTINVFGVSPIVLDEGIIRSVCLNVQHPFVDDLDIFLLSPGGQFLELTTDNGANADNYTNTCFTPTATTPIKPPNLPFAPAGAAPFTGDWQPEGPWTDLWDGEYPTNGAWRLQLIDDANGFVGSLLDWTITFEPSYKVNYQWSPIAGLACPTCPATTANPSQTTTYTLLATDSYGCTVSDTVTIEVVPALAAPVVSCAGSSSSNIDFQWSPVPNADSYEVNINGTGWVPANGVGAHQVNGLVPNTNVTIQVRGVSNLFNCAANIGTASCVNCQSPSALLNITQVSCFGGNNGAVLVTPDGLNPPYTFDLGSQTNTTGSFQNLGAGNYVVTITDVSSCSVALTVNVTAPPQLTATSAVQQQVSCFGGNDAIINVNAVGGFGSYNYTWSGGLPNSPTASNLAIGSYTVTVRDANNCSATASASITQPSDLGAVAVPVAAKCFNEPNGSVAVLTNGGTTPYGYLWSNGSSSMLNAGLLASTYSVTVTDAKGCTETASATVTQPTELSATTATTPTSCFGGNDGSATVLPTGGTLPYSYAWNDPAQQSGSTATNLSAQIYGVSVTDANGCKTQQTTSVASPTALTLAFGQTNVACKNGSNGSATVTASGSNGGYQYQWSSNPPQASATASNLPAGNYTVLVSDSKGCSATGSVVLSEPAQIQFVGSVTDASCFGDNDGQITTQTSGGVAPYSYAWSAGQSGANLVSSPAGIYTATVTDANGCTQTLQRQIGQASEIQASASPQAVLCHGLGTGALALSVNGGTPGYNTAWAGPNNYAATGNNLSNLFAGNYVATITDAAGCSKVLNTLVAQPDAPLALSLPPVADTICFQAADGNAKVLVSGGTQPYNYFWNVNGQNTATASGLIAGEYFVTVTDANNCLASAETIVVQKGELFAYTQSESPGCNAGSDGIGIVRAVFYAADSANVNNFNYLWSTTPPQTTRIATGLSAAQTYVVTVTDAQGCSDEQSITVGNPDLLEARVLSVGNTKCFGDSTGWAAADGRGGRPPYTYFWATGGVGQSDSLAINLPAGSYRVTVKDMNGCPAVAVATIEQPAALALQLTPRHVTCFGESTGSVVSMPSGGTAPYAFDWGNGQTNANASGLPAGNATVLMRDNNGCTLEDSVLIRQPDKPLLGTAEKQDPKCPGARDGSINITAEGGTPPYRYGLGNGPWNGSPLQIGIGAGSHTPRVVDANGCITVLDPIALAERSALQVDLGPDFSIILGEDTQLLAQVSNAVGAIQYQWSAEDSVWLSCMDCRNPSVYSLYYENDFEILVTDSLGCAAEDRVRITVEKPRRIFVPTGFTPNSDTSNDRLLVHGQTSAKVLQFRVYDRWGELLYEASNFRPNDEAVGWDGSFRGKAADGGVYVWVLEVEYMDGVREVLKGNTMLLR
jgi:gliding motility-associated-like protein